MHVGANSERSADELLLTGWVSFTRGPEVVVNHLYVANFVMGKSYPVPCLTKPPVFRTADLLIFTQNKSQNKTQTKTTWDTGFLLYVVIIFIYIIVGVDRRAEAILPCVFNTFAQKASKTQGKRVSADWAPL